MLKSSLTNLAIVVLFSIFFFALITQRMMTTDHTAEIDSRPLKKINGSESPSYPIFSRLSNAVANNTRSFLREVPVTVVTLNASAGSDSEHIRPTNAVPVVVPPNSVVSRTFGKAKQEPVTVAEKNKIDPILEVQSGKPTKIETKPEPAPKNNDLVQFLGAADALVKVVKRTIKPKDQVEFLDAATVKPPPPKPPVTVEKDRIHFLDSSEEKKKKAKASASQELEFLDPFPVPPHAPISPRFGSDISPAAQSSLIQCHNQSRCVVPELQLQKKYKIYFCKHPPRSGGVRFYYIAREGFLLHPGVEMLPQERMYDADYVVYLPGSAAWHRTECNDTTLAKKLIVLDEFDGHTLIAPTVGNSSEYARLYGSVAAPWYFMYFKRSFVRRSDGIFEGYPHLKQIDTYPMTYAVAEIYIRHMFKNEERSTDLWCTLRGDERMATRLRVQTWVAEYSKSRALKKVITSNLNTDTRTVISKVYFESMYDAQILVTVNPMMWEGDFRLWEAMGTGALVFVDPVFVPHPFPLISGEHVIYFSNHNKTELFAKLDYYRRNKEEARRIAINGYLHAMKYHRTVNLIDYVLRTTHMKEATLAKAAKLPQYSFTGQYLNQEAKKQLETIKECQYPGIYDDPLAKNSRNVSALTKGAAREHAQRLQCSSKHKLNTNIQFLTRH